MNINDSSVKQICFTLHLFTSLEYLDLSSIILLYR